jgi:lipopolysaccharide/colanic/teichoic acid biosynthesis glycosyltransferase
MHDLSSFPLGQNSAAVGSSDQLFAPVAEAPSATVRVVSQSGLPLHFLSDVPLIPAYSPSRVGQLAAKRLLDVTLAVLALVFVAPLLLFVAIAIKATSAGPIFFVQDRVGRAGSIFRILKFRTMYVDSCDNTGITQVKAGDHRITPLGQFLRRTSVDELPQILNILVGDMSFVGPRPHVPEMLAGGMPYDRLVPYYVMRNEMLPGLTGWAQANGLRGPTVDPVTAKGRVDHDLAYIQNFSLRLDLWILLLTVQRELFSNRAF